MKKLTIAILSVLLFIGLCACTNADEEKLNNLTMAEIYDANSFAKVGAEHFAYTEIKSLTNESVDESINYAEYIEYSTNNGILMYTDEYYQNDVQYYSAAIAMQESDNSYGMYYQAEEGSYAVLIDFETFDYLTDTMWYTTSFEQSEYYTDQVINERKIDENGNFVLSVSDQVKEEYLENEGDTYVRKMEFTIEKDTLYILSCKLEYYYNDEYSGGEIINVTIEDKAIMIPTAYNNLVGEGECEIIFRSLDGDVDVIYHLAEGTEYSFYFESAAVYSDEKAENDVSYDVFNAQKGTTVFYTLKY